LLTIEVKGDKSVYLDDVFFSSKHTQSGLPALDGFDPRKEVIGYETNYLIEKPQYVVSYNNETKNANWVSWQLNQSWLGSDRDRFGKFVTDLTLPNEFEPHPDDLDYARWTRGHLTAAAERVRTEKDYLSTFILSNINPQLKSVNGGSWEGFETYLQEEANQGKDIHIIAGSYEEHERISSKEIRVPKYFWKVALILKQPGLNLAEIQAEDIENVIAVRMPNQKPEGSPPVDEDPTKWKTRIRTVEFIEERTGVNFFGRLPEGLADELKEYRVQFDSQGNPKSFR
jgi:endonuclease G